MKPATIGTTYTSTGTVTEALLACSVGSGDARVLSTPMLTALMENAAMNCIKEFLDDGETTVGTYIAVEHISATPVGMEFSATAEVTAQNGREIEFNITACDDAGIIGKAVHKRVAVLAEKFQTRTDAKLNLK